MTLSSRAVPYEYKGIHFLYIYFELLNENYGPFIVHHDACMCGYEGKIPTSLGPPKRIKGHENVDGQC